MNKDKKNQGELTEEQLDNISGGTNTIDTNNPPETQDRNGNPEEGGYDDDPNDEGNDGEIIIDRQPGGPK